MGKINAVITGVGGYVPDYILNNEELSRMVDTTDEWITTRVGIKERRILTEEGLGKMSSLVDYTDRATCVLFGDGAGAVLVEATEEENVGVQNSYLRTDGQGLPFLHMKAGGSVCPPSHFTVDHRLHYLYQEGRTVFRYAVTDMSNDVMKIMEMNNLKADDVNWVIPHEANLRIIEAVTKRAGIPLDKVVVNIDHYGNTSAATIPLALWDAESQLKKGDNVIFTAFGAGFVHGASFYKWAYDGAAYGK